MTVDLHWRRSSLRCRSPRDTLALARAWASDVGIEAVDELTQRDVLGLPVFISRRRAPSSRTGAKADPIYAYGKGLEAIDAEIGAYMEAIECALTGPEAGDLGLRPQTRWATPREIAGASEDPRVVLELCPRLGRSVELDEPMLLAAAEQLDPPTTPTADEPAWLPAELAFFPAPASVGQSIYGSTTNGLASGNTTLEATVHALCELLERDVWSFEFIRRSSVRVADASLPEPIRAVVERARAGGLELVVRTIVNEHELPFFAAFVFDPQNPIVQWFNAGWGCHLDPSIALTRAVTEAAQSRLAFIHGGRSKPRRAAGVLPRSKSRSEREQIEAQIAQVRDARGARPFSELARGRGIVAPEDLDHALALLLARVRRATGRRVYRLRYTGEDSPLAVVRVVAPGLEHFDEARMRVGPRLQAALARSAAAAASSSVSGASQGGS